MKYNCANEFMIRTPQLPYKYWLEYLYSKCDIYEFISANDELDSFFRKALLISSKDLYNMYINKPEKQKKYKSLCTSLLRYFIRATTRPTPYGYYAGVSMGTFSDGSSFIREDELYDVKLDTNWINEVIKNLENDEKLLKNLKLKFNDICFISGDRMINPYSSNRGSIKDYKDLIRETSIRYTNLILLIKNSSDNFIEYADMFSIIKEQYKNVPDIKIQEVLFDLVKNEYLFTNLKIPAYCNDTLSYVINILENINSAEDIYCKFLKIKYLIKKLKSEFSEEIANKLYAEMASLAKSRNYIEFNLGYKYNRANLCARTKIKIEKFLETLSYIALPAGQYNKTEKFKSKLLENYGSNIEVPLIELIDASKFNGLTLIDDSVLKESETENNIDQIIKSKIELAILSKTDVHIEENDFKNIDNSDVILPKGLDLNLFITFSDGKYSLTVGPNIGSYKQGSMFQRFADCFNMIEFKKYMNIYDKVKSLSEDDYIEVELRECAISGRMNNVVNNTKNYPNYLAIGFYGNEKGRVDLSDILVGIENDIVYFKSKKLKKKLKFVKDNMLNVALSSGIFRLLYELSQKYEGTMFDRLYMLKDKRIYTPRIYIENIIVSLKQWRLHVNMFDFKNFKEFEVSFEAIKSKLNIDKLAYIVDSDRRLLIDTTKKEGLEMIYKILKKNNELVISEIEPNLLKNELATSDNYNLVTELVFSATLDKSNTKKIFNETTNCDLDYKTEILGLCENGWIYFKVYGAKERMNELLTIDLQNLIKYLDNPNYFFIRYIDEIGEHLRIRIKFKDESSAYEKLPIINNWINKCKKRSLINKVMFDEYSREINRYGGTDLINIVEEFFFEDSKYVSNVLDKRNLELDEEKIYISNILEILMYLTESEKALLELIDMENQESIFRTEYKKNRKDYIGLVENIMTQSDINPEKKKYFEKLNEIRKKMYSSNKLTNTIEDISLSIVHMHCNRLTGNRVLEAKYIAILRHSLYDYISKKKYMSK